MTSIVLHIPGTPTAKGRPRATKTGRLYTPAKTRTAEGVIASIAMDRIPAPFDGPVSVEIEARFRPAESWSGAKKARHLGQPHTQRPDLDNIQKAVLDGLNGIAWRDDAQVAEAVVRKVWAEEAETVVTVRSLAGAAFQARPGLLGRAE